MQMCPGHLAVKSGSLYRLPVCPSATRYCRVSSILPYRAVPTSSATIYQRGVPQISKWIIVEVCPGHLVVKTGSLCRLPVCPSAARFYRVSSSSDVVSDDLPTIIN